MFKVGDTTFGVKVPEELKDEISKLMQTSGLTGKEFMQVLINAYQVEQTKIQLPEVTQDLKELQGLTQRINNIYLSLGYRIDNLLKSKDTEIENQLRKKDGIIFDFQDKFNDIDSKNQILTEAFNNCVNEKNALNEQVNQLTNMYNDNKSLVEEYKSKNDMLTGLLSKYEKYSEEFDDLNIKLKEAENKNFELEKNISFKVDEITRIKDTMEHLKEEQAAEMSRLREQLEFKLDKALLVKDKEHQLEINALNKIHNEKLQEQLSENREYNSKISKLIEENQLKTDKLNEQVELVKNLITEIEILKSQQTKAKKTKKI